jgi:hypothetical protein
MTPNFDLLFAISSKQKSTDTSSPKLSESWIVADKASGLSNESDQIMTVTWIGIFIVIFEIILIYAI